MLKYEHVQCSITLTQWVDVGILYSTHNPMWGCGSTNSSPSASTLDHPWGGGREVLWSHQDILLLLAAEMKARGKVQHACIKNEGREQLQYFSRSQDYLKYMYMYYMPCSPTHPPQVNGLHEFLHIIADQFKTIVLNSYVMFGLVPNFYVYIASTYDTMYYTYE